MNDIWLKQPIENILSRVVNSVNTSYKKNVYFSTVGQEDTIYMNKENLIVIGSYSKNMSFTYKLKDVKTDDLSE